MTVSNIIQVWLGKKDNDLQQLLETNRQPGESDSNVIKRLLRKSDSQQLKRIENKINQILEGIKNE